MDLSTGLALWNLISLNVQLVPSSGEMELRYEMDKKLRRDLFKTENVAMPSRNGEGLELISFMTIDHIRSIDENKGALTLSVTFVFTWMDERLMWNASNYAGIQEVSCVKYEVYPMALWLPTINVADMPGSGKQPDLFGNHEVDLLFQSNGMVKATIKTLITLPCYFSFGEYPNDYQNCSLTLISPYYADEFRFAQFGGIAFARQQINDRVTDVEDFQLIDYQAKSYYMYLGVDIIQDYKKFGPQYCRSFFRYSLMLKRVNKLLFAELTTPMICISMFLFLSSVLPNKYGLAVLLLTTVFEIVLAIFMARLLPDNFEGMPPIGAMATFIFFETLVLSGWKVFSIITRHRIHNLPEPKSPQNIQLLKGVIWTDLGLIVYLLVHGVVTIHIAVKN